MSVLVETYKEGQLLDQKERHRKGPGKVTCLDEKSVKQ